MTSNPNNVEPYIWRFICAVYPSAPNLALASFSEEKALTDATDEIERLKRERDEAKAALAAASSALTSVGGQADRLRAALERINQDEFGVEYQKDQEDWQDDYWRVVNIARNALGPAVETASGPHRHEWITYCRVCHRALRDINTGAEHECTCWDSPAVETSDG